MERQRGRPRRQSIATLVSTSKVQVSWPYHHLVLASALRSCQPETEVSQAGNYLLQNVLGFVVQHRSKVMSIEELNSAV
jgi:hypothetical protein